MDIWRICQRGPSAGLPFLASRQGGHDRGIDQLTGDHRGDQCVDAEHQQDHLRVRKWKWHLCGRCNNDFGAESSSSSCSNPPKKGCPRHPKMMSLIFQPCFFQLSNFSGAGHVNSSPSTHWVMGCLGTAQGLLFNRLVIPKKHV